jgi:hypothetical protein
MTLDKSFELNSTSREAVIAMESRDHLSNGVSPKDQMSRGNFKFLLIVFCLMLGLHSGSGQNPPLEYKNVVCNCSLKTTERYYSNEKGYYYDDVHVLLKEYLSKIYQMLNMDNQYGQTMQLQLPITLTPLLMAI